MIKIVKGYLRYADAIWESLAMRKTETLHSLQDSALLIHKSARVKDNQPCDWLKVNNPILFHQLVKIYKIMSKLCPESL